METTRENPYISNEDERSINGETHNSDDTNKVQFEDEFRAWKNSAIIASAKAPDLKSSTIKTNEIQGWRRATTLQKQALRFDASTIPIRSDRDTDEFGKSISMRQLLWDRLTENNEGSIGSSPEMDVNVIPSFNDHTKLDDRTRLSCDIFSVYFNDHHTGLFGYNAALIGIGLASFHSLEVHGGYSPVIVACVMIVSILSVILFSSLTKFLLAYEISPMTLPFDIIVSLTLLASNGMANVEFGAVIPPSLPSYTTEQDTPDYNLDASTFMGIVLRGIGQIVFATDPLAIALVIAGLTLCSRQIAIAAVVGSALGTGISILVGLNAEEVDLGLYSYCSALTFIGTLVFYVPTLMSILLAALGVLFTVIFQAALSSLFQISGLPVNSFPFSFVIISFVLCQGNAKAFVGVPLESITFPEDHLKRVRLLRDGFHLFLEALRSYNEDGVGNRKIANSNRSRKVLTKLYSTLNFDSKIEIEESDKIGQNSLQMFENMEKKHHKGYITFDDFEEFLGKIGMNGKAGLYSARKVLSLLDIDNNDMISKQEWVVFCRLSYELQKIHDIVSTFFQFVDTSGDGLIQISEVNDALNYLSEPELNFDEMKTIGRIAHSPEEFEIREMTTFVSIETLKTLVKKYHNRPSSQRNKNNVMEEV